MASGRSSGGRFITFAGMVLGSVIGAAVALVYTPRKGEENRKRLAEQANARLEEVKNKTSDTVAEARDKVGL